MTNNQNLYEDDSVNYTENYYTEYEPYKELDYKKSENNGNKGKKKRNILVKILILLLVTLLGGAVGSYWTIKFLEKEGHNLTQESTERIVIEENVENIAKAVAQKAKSSVVAVTSVEVTNDWFYGQSISNGMGSGVVVSKDGYILTNSHVISFGNGKNIRVFLEGQDIVFSGQADPKDESVSGYIADIVWNNPENDIALLKINPPHPLNPAELGDSSKVEVGDIAVAIGNPIDVNFKSTVTQGIVSGLGRNVTVKASSKTDNWNPFSRYSVETSQMTGLIQTDAAINSGNSGGPLLNSKGQVIGINTIKAGSAGVEGLGFAIPINSVKDLIPKLESGDLRTVLFGIEAYSIPQYEEMVKMKTNINHGLIVMKVMEDSPADKAGIKPHDVIYSIEDKDINSIEELRTILSGYKLNDKKNAKIIRAGEIIDLTITFDKWNE